MTVIELRQKLIDRINRLSLQKLLFLEELIQSLELFFPEAKAPDPPVSELNSGNEIPQIHQPAFMIETHFLSESTLSKDWLSAEEDRVWQDL
ncbi:MAG: hypothetical protein HC936_00360 [Leptolyngbyaceae cyanobacterium SU_3_3]|nr:hypothetical protein [Leptolyngbyaceae cyanobacterium SU_3_3]